MQLLRTGTCADSVWTLLTEQGVRFRRNLCVPLTRFTWHPPWLYVPPSRAWNSEVLTIAFAGPVSSSDSDFNPGDQDRKSTRLNSSHGYISYAVFCLKKKKHMKRQHSMLPSSTWGAHRLSRVLAISILRRLAVSATQHATSSRSHIYALSSAMRCAMG